MRETTSGAQISIENAPTALSAGSRHILLVDINNTSATHWSSSDVSGVMLGNRWFSAEDHASESDFFRRILVRKDGVAPLPAISAGKSKRLFLPIEVPDQIGELKLSLRLNDSLGGQVSIALTKQPPILIGGTDGTGISAISQILSAAGVYLGEQEQAANSTGMLGEWYQELLPYWGGAVPMHAKVSICKKLDATVNTFLPSSSDLKDHVGWGWKLPPHVFYTPFFQKIWPELRCVHMVRDGRDMALSSNQNQLGYLGPIALAPEEQFLPETERSLLLWQRLNLELSQQADEQFSEHYLCLRYEDLISRPEETIQQLFDFLEIDKSASDYTRFIKEPLQVSRWHQQSAEEQIKLTELARPSLTYFGYLKDE